MSETHGLEGLCDVDPLDPEVEGAGSDLVGLMDRYRVWSVPDRDGLPPIMMRMRDTVFERARAVLCRFEPAFAADVHRSLASRAPSIRDASPSVVAGSLVHDAAVLGAAEVDVLCRWLEELHRDPDLHHKEVDVSAPLLTAVLPHLPADRQFAMLLMQRADARDAFWLGRAMRPLPDPELGERLERAIALGDEAGLRLLLIFAAETGADLAVVRPAISRARRSDDPRTRAAGLRSMVRLRDVEGMAALADSGWGWSRIAGRGRLTEDFCGSVALLEALVGSDDATLPDRLHPSLWSRAAERGGPALLSRVADLAAAAINDVPSEAIAPDGMGVTVVRYDGRSMTDDLGDDVGHSIGFSSSGGHATSPDGARRKRLDMGDFFALLQRLTDLGRDALLHPPTSLVVDRLAAASPAAFEALLVSVERAVGDGSDRTPARAAAMLALDMARSISGREPDRAAALFARAAAVPPLYPEEMPISRLPRSTLLLWRAADGPGIVAQRRRRLDGASNDEDLAFEVLAAEMAGKHGEIVAYAAEGLSNRHPARIARSVTVAGFASADPALDPVFRDDRLEHGFLARVRNAARRSYDEARWAEHWSLEARGAEANLDVWRFGELALSCADARSVLWWEAGRGGRMFETLRPLSRSALEATVASKNRDRRARLFGELAPPEDLRPSVPEAGI